MSSASFTKEEQHLSAARSFSMLWRLVMSLRLLKLAFIPTLILIAIATALPQIVLWTMGAFVRCSNNASQCEALLPWGLGSAHPTLRLICILIVVSIGMRVLAWLVFELAGQWSAQDIHRACVRALSKVRVTFFDENPSGKLINRLIKDFDNLRFMGVIRIGDLLNALGDIFAAAIFVSFSQPLVLLFLLPTLAFFSYVQCNVALMLHRLGFLSSVIRGQFLHRETDVLEGLRQYRFYGAEAALFERIQIAARKFIDINYLRAHLEAWGRFWVSSGTSLFIFCSLLAMSYAVMQGSFSKAAAIVTVTILFRVTPAFTWLMWTSSYMIESVAVCQRVFGIVDLQREQEEESAVSNSPRRQPKQLSGEIRFESFSMSYRKDSPRILENLCLQLPEKKRIGIVGRTGAGKSSLLQSLFRMVYRQGGDLKIGADSIFDFDPEFIRQHFAVVPQESYLFKGSLRSNLDPKVEFDDKEILAALAKVDINFPLEFELLEEGGNISAGERQLVCLARALLLDRPYFVLDEPTSGLDTLTDAAIQRLLESELRDRTVITVAHRLETLHNYDTIIEVSGGVVRELEQAA